MLIDPHPARALNRLQVKAQATTASRSNVTERQQQRWHIMYDDQRAVLHKLNTDDGTGVQFSKVEDAFVLNYDEVCLNSADGIVNIIGSATKRKHEKEGSGRTTISMMQTISAAGSVGPVMSLMAGKAPREGYTDDFLRECGAPPGSKIVMTASGFMTDDGFDELAPSLAAGIRAMPEIRDHPEWWVLLSGDGFHAHKMTAAAQQELYDHKIIHIIEEGDSSHCNQAFDRQVAKHGKCCMREVLDLVNRCNVFTAMDQWGLLLVGLHSIRELVLRPDIVVGSFKSVNMQPSTRIDFPSWLKKIESFLVGGSKFADEGEVSPRALLPDWYKVWPEDRKKAALEVMRNGDGWGDADTVKALCAATGMSIGDVPGCQVCYFVETSEPPLTHPSSLAPVTTRTYDANKGLRSFTLMPDGMEGLELFSHLVTHRKRREREVERVYDTTSSDYLDLAFQKRLVEINGRHYTVSDQLKVINPTQNDLTDGAIMREVGTKTGSVKMPRRVLNNIGEINAYCTVANTPARIKKLRAILELAATIDAAKSMSAKANTEKAAETVESLIKKHAPTGMAHLRADWDAVGVLTANQMIAVAAKYMHKTLKKEKKQRMEDAFRAARVTTGWELRRFDKLVESSTNKVYYLDPSTNLTVWALPEDGYVNSNEEEASPGPG